MDPQKFPIEITTRADTSGAEAAQKAIADTAQAATAASQEAQARFEQEMERDRRAYEEKRTQQEKERGGNGPEDSAERTAAATEAFNTRARVQALDTLVRGLGEASRKIREFEDDLRAMNPELADMAIKGADAADGLAKIGQGALQGFAAAGPLGGAVGAVGSALMYMVEGLTASSRAEKEFEETLRRVNAETRAAQQGARDRADALERGRAAASDAARAEEDLADKLEAGGEALDAANDKLRYRLELLARQSKDQAEIIRLEEDLERKRIAASTMSEEEKATATTASRAREATRLAALEDETREQERRAQEEARALAKKTAEEAEREALRGRGMAPYVLSDKDREQMQQTVKDLRGEGGEETIARRKKLQEQLEADEAARKWLPGIRNADDLNKSIDSNDTTARQAREQEEEARRELERIAAEQAQAERRRGFAGRGSEIDRERDVRAGRRRDLEERERETDERGRGLATNIAAEAGAAAGKVKSDAGKDILQAIKSAFADGVLSDSERSNLTAAIKAVNSSKETEIVGTLREMLSAFESTRNELKAVREQVKSLRDR